MKLLEKNTNRTAIVNSDDRETKDASNDFFGGKEIVVEDINYCIAQIKDWVNAEGNFRDKDCKEMRLAIINNELYSNC